MHWEARYQLRNKVAAMLSIFITEMSSLNSQKTCSVATADLLGNGVKVLA